jgi:hypothetical protein
MKKQDNKAADYSHITPAIIQSVEIVLNDVSKHRYSTSGIYNAHNAVFGLREVPESCTSCLTNRANKLKQWYADYALAQADKGKDVYGEKLEAAAPTVPATEAAGANVPRETYTALHDIYAAYSAEFGYDPDEPENAMGEADAIAEITKQDAEATANGNTMLFDSERQLLADRLTELNTPNVDTTNADGSFIVKDKDGNVHEVTFTPDAEDATKGGLTFVNADKETKNMKPGTYTTDTGDSYAVQPGGKTTFKAGEESIL